jgi:hypothetical protein
LKKDNKYTNLKIARKIGKNYLLLWEMMKNITRALLKSIENNKKRKKIKR